MPAQLTAEDLRNITLFNGLEPDHLLRLQKFLGRKSFPTNAQLLTADWMCEMIYFILSGTVRISIERADGADVLLAICGVGEILGEIGVTDGCGPSADVGTLEPTEVLWMRHSDFHECLHTMPPLAMNLAVTLAQRLRRATIHIQTLAIPDVHSRLALQLLSFANSHGRPVANGDVEIPLRLTQSDLAALCGASRQRVNQAIGYYKRHQYLSVDRDLHITLHNPDALARRCR